MKSYSEIKTSLEASYEDRIAKPLNFSPASVFGTHTAITAETLTSLYQMLQAIKSSLDVDTATDESLDNIGKLSGLTRLQATATTVIADLEAKPNTVIHASSKVAASGINTLFSLSEEVILTNQACLYAKIEVTNLVTPSYQVLLNSANFTHALAQNDTSDIIINDLAVKINNANIGITASNVDSYLVLTSNNLFSVLLSDGFNIESLKVKAKFVADTKGYIPLPAKLLTEIKTPIDGWISIYNANAGDNGRDLESDLDFRIRIKISNTKGASSTIAAIRANLLNVTGVTSVTMFENDTPNTINGRPPKCFEALVQGGVDQDIASAIWQYKGGGIQAYGNNIVQVVDEEGTSHGIGFSRPVPHYIYINIVYQKNETNVLPLDAEAQIRLAICDQFKSQKVGDPVIYQSLYRSVYGVPGIKNATITIGETLNINNPPQVLTSTNIEIASPGLAVTDTTKITITLQV
jgi:uncharacterized phage protein gp47/JayE